MVNTARVHRSGLSQVTCLISVYVLVALGTVAALAIMTATNSGQATDDAWVHAVIVGAFAILLPLRLRPARRGSRRALTAVGVIATVLIVVNVVEAFIPDLFPAWMRIEMVGIAVLMLGIATCAVHARR